MKKVIIAIVVLLGLLLSVFFLFIDKKTQIKEQIRQVITAEPKTETFVKKFVNEHWEADVFDDFGAKYNFMCDDVKKIVAKEKYIAKYKADREERPLAKPNKVDVGEARIEGNIAVVRITAYTPFYTEGSSSISNLKYEGGKWCVMVKEDTKKWLAE